VQVGSLVIRRSFGETVDPMGLLISIGCEDIKVDPIFDKFIQIAIDRNIQV
jgi:hypothetical protein